MKRLPIPLALILVLSFIGTGFAEQAGHAQSLLQPGASVTSGKPTADEILKKVDEALNPYQDLSMTSMMTILSGDGKEKIRELRVWQKGEKRMVKFVKPASERNISLLSTGPKTNYVYLPAYKKIRRVAAHMRNQTFLGTDFSQEDMALIRYADDYAPRRIGETDTHWELELTPKPDAAVGYGKLRLKVKKGLYLLEQIDYFEKSGAKQKVEERMNFKLYDGKYWNASNMRMTTVKDNHQTLLNNIDQRFDTGLSDSFFSPRNLQMPVK